jgi:lysosomal Pro-X carboxypeptidase
VASKVIKQQGGQACYDTYSRGFFDLNNLKYDFTKYAKIQEIFNLCKAPEAPEDVQNLIDTVSDSIGTMAMVNYPYETNFVNPLPEWPQKVAC